MSKGLEERMIALRQMTKLVYPDFNDEQIEDQLKLMVPSYYELLKLEADWKASPAYAYDQLRILEEHMSQVHNGKTAECLDGNGKCGMKFEMDPLKEHVKVITDALIDHITKENENLKEE